MTVMTRRSAQARQLQAAALVNDSEVMMEEEVLDEVTVKQARKSATNSKPIVHAKDEALPTAIQANALDQDTKEEDDPHDWPSMLLLLVLYTLQGIPMGLSASIPFLLQSKVGYREQATFSLVSWPFSLKLLWAPFVDSLYSQRYGRRKSWLVPVQLLCAVLMIGGSVFVSDMLGEQEGQTPQVLALTVFFFVLYLLMATQDIAVDGWALTMLSSKHVGHASTCNSVGQTLGYFVAYVGFLAFHDPATCNAYFRQSPLPEGMVSLGGFMGFWGWVMLITTIFVAIFKQEKDHGQEEKLSIRQTYYQMYSVLRLPAVISFSIVLLTSRIGFAAAESVASLKMVEYGLQKEKLALLTPILIPLGIFIPVFLGRFISAGQPLKLYLLGYPFRLAVGLLYAIIVYITPSIMAQDDSTHVYYFAFLLFCGGLHEVASNMMYVPQMAFSARISDPSIGGTYMTFLNTISNLGAKWPSSVSLALVDVLTTRECSGAPSSFTSACSNLDERTACTDAGGTCVIVRDGYFVESIVCTVLGIVWMAYFARRVVYLQNLKLDKWRISGVSD